MELKEWVAMKNYPHNEIGYNSINFSCKRVCVCVCVCVCVFRVCFMTQHLSQFRSFGFPFLFIFFLLLISFF